jgi:hypothetical protein
MTLPRRLDLGAAVIGCIAVVAALAIIWGARVTIPRDLYVSELGAVGMPTAEWFRSALLLIVVGGTLIAWAGRGVHSLTPVLRAWTPAVSLWIGCAFFLFASQVTCTAGCPLPYGPSFNLQDFLHTLAAVLAFGFACWAMLQASFAREHRMLARLSLIASISVAVIAGTGGLLALFKFQQGFGSRLELVATTIAIAWVVLFGVVLAVRAARPGRVVAASLDHQEEPELVAAP